MAQIFISHSEKDNLVIDKFFDLLKLGCDLTNKEVFCSSIEAAGIKVGSEFVEWIKNHLVECDLVILFVTPNYLNSKFCIAEMGAAWALNKDVFPILHPALDRELGFVFLGKQTARLDGTGLDNLKDRISEHIESANRNTATWSIKRKEFIENLQALLEELPTPDKYTKEEYDNIIEEREAANNLYKKANQDKERLQSIIDDLKKAKNAEEVKEIERKSIPDHEVYDTLVEEVYDDLRSFNAVIIRCLYAYFSQEDWFPQDDTWRWKEAEIKKAKQSEIIEDGATRGSLTINYQHPKISPVIEKINELEKFIDEDMTPKLAESIENENRIILNISNREYWEEELLRDSIIE